MSLNISGITLLGINGKIGGESEESIKRKVQEKVFNTEIIGNKEYSEQSNGYPYRRKDTKCKYSYFECLISCNFSMKQLFIDLSAT